MGDKYFDYADLFWQNEFDSDMSVYQQARNEIGIQKKDEIEKFEYFEMLSMITWGLWALRRSSDGKGTAKNALLKAIKLGSAKKL